MAEFSERRGWQVGKSLSQCLEHLLINELSTDVTINITSSSNPDKGTQMSAHKLILCARSPVFEAMFSGNFVENNEVNITDTEPEPFKDMLRYLYTDDVALNGSNVLHVEYLARKYILEDLAKKCSDYLENSVSPDNVCDILKYSLQFGKEEVTKRCLDFSSSNTAAVIASEGFINMSQEALLTFLKYDCLAVDQEEAIIQACIRWVEKQKEVESKEGDLRDILGDCIHQIRFFQLSADRLVKIIGNSTILDDAEKTALLSYSVSKQVIYANKLYHLGFQTHSRSLQFERKSANSNPVQHVSTVGEELIQLSVSDACVLLGVSVFGGDKGYQHNTEIELKEQTSDAVSASTTQSTFTSPGIKLVPVYFREEVTLLPGKQYILKAKPPHDGRSIYFRPSDAGYFLHEQLSVKLNYAVQSFPGNDCYGSYGYIKVFHLAKSYFYEN